MCAATSRIFVHESVYDKFLELFTAAAQSVRQGDGFNKDADQGPLVSKTQLDVRAEFLLSRAQALTAHSASWGTSRPASKRARGS